MTAHRNHIRRACFLGIAAFSLSAQVLPPNLTALAEQFGLDHFQRGRLAAAQYAGFFVAALLGGWLSDRFGRKPFIVGGLVLTALGLSGAPFAPTYLLFVGAILCVGAGGGLVEALTSAALVDLFPERKAQVMNVSQFFYNVGASAMPFVAGWSLGMGWGWKPCFGLAAAACVACAVWIGLLRFPALPAGPAEGPASTRLTPRAGRAVVVVLALMMFLYVGGEMTMNTWGANYLEETFGTGRPSAARVLSLFWLAMLVGRLAFAVLVERWSYLWPILVSALCATLMAVVAIVAPSAWLGVVGIVGLGLFLSGIWPTIVAYASQRFPGRGWVIGTVVSFGSAGLLAFPPLCGLIAKHSPRQLRAGLTLVPIVLLALAAVTGVLLWRDRRRPVS